MASSAPASSASQIELKPVAPEARLIDVMHGAARIEARVHEHGFLALVDAMPRLVPEGQTADSAVVQAARVSYGQGTKKVHEDRGLIRYLLRHRHTTPFEMIEFKFHVAMPIFVARQWIRHRTANVNEYSARYSILPDRFYIPSIDEVRKQSRANRQGGEDIFKLDAAAELKTAEQFIAYLNQVEQLYAQYRDLTEQGVSRELARIGLPVNVYTEWYWKCDLHNVLRFLSLRLDAHAQAEIRAYAAAMLALIEPIVPLTVEAWRDYELESMRLTRLEIEAIRSLRNGGTGEIASDNQREKAEWAAKCAALGLSPRSA
ncbi:MAG: FAD-dependent thymidylate synthase [Phycisphaeraceae bacterium]|nr:FAD-dependent thymidylate synthase [Phycisphaeraceae bacterium]MCW5753319.1 FAD-dependent thymidylate synthase [Phycisphaeraceae bacterium]